MTANLYNSIVINYLMILKIWFVLFILMAVTNSESIPTTHLHRYGV